MTENLLEAQTNFISSTASRNQKMMAQERTFGFINAEQPIRKQAPKTQSWDFQ